MDTVLYCIVYTTQSTLKPSLFLYSWFLPVWYWWWVEGREGNIRWVVFSTLIILHMQQWSLRISLFSMWDEALKNYWILQPSTSIRLVSTSPCLRPIKEATIHNKRLKRTLVVYKVIRSSIWKQKQY